MSTDNAETEAGEPSGDVSDPAVGEHVRPTSEEYTAGTYRVVGASDPIALLRVTDEHDRREFTGHLLTVDRATVEADFEVAEDPDGEVDPVLEFRNVVSGMYWTVRKFLPR